MTTLQPATHLPRAAQQWQPTGRDRKPPPLRVATATQGSVGIRLSLGAAHPKLQSSVPRALVCVKLARAVLRWQSWGPTAAGWTQLPDGQSSFCLILSCAPFAHDAAAWPGDGSGAAAGIRSRGCCARRTSTSSLTFGSLRHDDRAQHRV
jgi:hypothetical protein